MKHVNTKALNDNIFVLERPDSSYILYAPLSKKAGVINGSGVNTIVKHLDNEVLSDKESEFIRQLYEQDFLTEKKVDMPVFPEGYSYMPHEVTLFVTSRCNLRCRYCYADAGKSSQDMKFETARAAVDLVANNAGLCGLPRFTVGFHGGGEPTVAWSMVTQIVEYAQQTAEQKGLDVEIFAATNGIFNAQQREYIVKHFTNLNISIDGPEDIQNYNRPTVNGSGSFAVIKDNLKYFDECKFQYGVRATITEKNIRELPQTVEWFKSEFNIDYLHIEPVWQCGRCITSGELSPSDDDFIHYYMLASEKADLLNVKLIYSGLRLDSLISKFCAASGDGFNVLPDGTVTSCYEVTEANNPKAELFHYGRYDSATQSFVFEHDKIKRLQGYSVENLNYCSDCFCKWHCAGDCISKVFDVSGSFEHQGSSRCLINRTLTLKQLEKLITIQNNKTNGAQ